MTLPHERDRAVQMAGDFLRRLSSPYVEGGIKGIRREVRQEALAILRHYPLPVSPAVSAARSGVTGPQKRPKWMDDPVLVDPPSGWKYGFPRLYDRKHDGPLLKWLVANGYPQHMAQEGLACRYMIP